VIEGEKAVEVWSKSRGETEGGHDKIIA